MIENCTVCNKPIRNTFPAPTIKGAWSCGAESGITRVAFHDPECRDLAVKLFASLQAQNADRLGAKQRHYDIIEEK